MRGVFVVIVGLVGRAAVFVIVAVVVAGVLVQGQPAVAASSDMASVPSVELAQTDDPSNSPSQTATGDGTLPFRILTVAMASLAGILGMFTYWYWRATVPPARRGFSPPLVDPGAEAEHPAGPIGYLRASPGATPEDTGELGEATPDLNGVPEHDGSPPSSDPDDAGLDLAPNPCPEGAPPDLVVAPDFDESVVGRGDVGKATAPSAVGE